VRGENEADGGCGGGMLREEVAESGAGTVIRSLTGIRRMFVTKTV